MIENYIDILYSAVIFTEIEKNDILKMIRCMSANTISYNKGETIFLVGEKAERVGFILSGKVQIIKDDYYGNRSIVSRLEKGNMFGEAFACAGIKEIPVSVMAVTDCNILMFNYLRMMTSCGKDCFYHHRLIFNMLRTIAEENIRLEQKIEFTSKRTTRDKLLAYLTSQAEHAEKKDFTIPFNRQELADYLSVDRSAMSTELSKLRDDNLIEYRKNKFIIKI